MDLILHLNQLLIVLPCRKNIIQQENFPELQYNTNYKYGFLSSTYTNRLDKNKIKTSYLLPTFSGMCKPFVPEFFHNKRSDFLSTYMGGQKYI